MSTNNKPSSSNFRRKKTDYIWLASFFVTLVAVGEYFWGQERSSKSDREFIAKACNPLNFQDETWAWTCWLLIAVTAMTAITQGMWQLMKMWKPEASPSTHFSDQMKAIQVNMFLLGLVQASWDYASSKYAFAKVKQDRLEPWTALGDMCLWMLCFELSWYTQHRLMHDVKFLWTHGHAYHHTWKRPEHMIGVTNFAFDHVVEVWVTMSSSFLGYLLFPANFYVGKAISLAYMILAILVHWDGFSGSRYHINHVIF